MPKSKGFNLPILSKWSVETFTLWHILCKIFEKLNMRGPRTSNVAVKFIASPLDFNAKISSWFKMFFHLKNLKSENNDPWYRPWFNIVLNTQSIVCATVDSHCLLFKVLGIHNFGCILLGKLFPMTIYWQKQFHTRERDTKIALLNAIVYKL